jgi:hypothetical protein
MRLNHAKYYTLAAIVLAFSLLGCRRPPDLPDTPSISFNDISFEVSTIMVGPVAIETTTLKLTFNVSDGDGDIGLDGAESGRPFNEFDFVLDTDGSIVEFGQRPADPPFTCLNYIIEAPQGVPEDATFDYNDDGDTGDTILVAFNENRFNIFVDFLVRQPDGTFEEEDIRTWPPGSDNEQTFCNTETFDGRIPCLSSEDEPCDFVRSTNRPIEGTITYDMISSGFLPVFRAEPIKLRFYIKDRALNQSNIVETPEFTLQDIRVDVTG